MSEYFDGFPSETWRFLKTLSKNNNRDWFNANKNRYETAFLEPSLAFIEAMQGPLKKVSSFFRAVPKRSGGSLMRIYRDTRFAKDKTPYKTNIGIHFRHEMGRDIHAPGYYVHIKHDEAFVGAGIWRPESKDLKKIRHMIVDDEDRWRKITKSKTLTNHFEFAGDSLKRPPREFDANHALIHDVKRKDFFVLSKLSRQQLEDRELPKNVGKTMQKASRFMEFLCDALHVPF